MIVQANALHLPIRNNSVQTVVTSPPYWGLRDYATNGQLGLEHTPEEYVARMVEVFREVRRVMRKDGTLWLNMGDSYAGSWGNYGGQNRGNGSQRTITNGSKVHQKSYDGIESWRPPTSSPPGLKPKDLVGIPWRVAFALQADGWWLRSDIIWHKPNPMPESVTDRPTKSHEYLFLLSKSASYYYNAEAIREPMVKSASGSTFTEGKTGVNGNGRVSQAERFDDPAGRNKRSVWTIATQSYNGAHFATFPEKLVEPCILAGSRPGDIVLDPFAGSGTVIRVARRFQRKGVGCDLNFAYLSKQATKRMRDVQVEMCLR